MVATTSDTVKSNALARRLTRLQPYVLTVAAGVTIFLLALDGGSYSVQSRATVAIAALWAVLMGLVVSVWPLATPPKAAYLGAGLLAAFAAWTGASMLWAESAERAFAEFNRVALYLAIFLVAVLAATRGNLGRWLDGIALGITATGLLALASRLYLDVLPAGQVPEFLPAAVTRLSYPVEYWNGLAILCALAFPLLLRAAALGHHPVWRGLAVAPLPALAATMYLTSSRGGFAAALVAMVVFVALTDRRWPAAGAIAVAGAGSVATIAVLLARTELVNAPFSSPEAVEQGHSAALLILAASLAAGIVYGLAAAFLERAVRVPTLAGRAAAVLVVLAALVALGAADPVGRFETFKQPPTEVEETDYVRAHLLSGNGSGRWQFWNVAVDQFGDEPLVGQGAGSYEAYWAQNTPMTFFVRDAHSLYLETLGELGVVGFLLLGGALVLGLVTGVRRLFGVGGEERIALAAVLAGFAGYLVAAGIDWMWELTVVSVVGILFLGFVTGPATAAAARPTLLRERATAPGRRRFALAAGALVVGWLLVCAQAIPLLANVKISDSQAAVREGDGAQALEDATAARNLQPWAASPYLQVALVQEALEEYDAAEESIRAAIERDPVDWRLWLAASRIQTKAGDIPEARRSLDRASELNPRSPLFASVR